MSYSALFQQQQGTSGQGSVPTHVLAHTNRLEFHLLRLRQNGVGHGVFGPKGDQGLSA